MDNDALNYSDGGAQPVATTPSFLLVPLNAAAKVATEHASNAQWQCTLDENTIGLRIDFPQDASKVLYTLGAAAECDIYLPEMWSSKGSSRISELHSSFELIPQTGAVLLWDHSEDGTVEPFSSSHSSSHSFTIKFRSSGPRSVLVARGINSRIAFGSDKWFQFELCWYSDGLYAFDKEEPYTVGPKGSRSKKYVQGNKVGGGAYGNVWCALDVTNGRIMAVKKFHSLSGKKLEFATREVANLFKINKDNSIQHEHILEIYASAGGGEKDDWGEIFMPLMLGNLKTLLETDRSDGSSQPRIDTQALSDLVLRQMLLALQCIAEHNIVHRDIKPENILWEYGADNGYHFRLGDFGLSNDPSLARTVAGTEPFMAPEVFHRQSQSTKVDIWSLFATIAWVRNTSNFRRACAHLRAQDIHARLVETAARPDYAPIQTMASMSPKKRPSAAEQLAILDQYDKAYAAGGLGPSESSANTTGDALETQLAGMTLQETPGMSFGSSSTEQLAPEIPYYEPYTSGVMENYWNETKQAGASKKKKRYMPPPAGGLEAPREQVAWVAAYENPYAPIDSEDSGTAVPEMWTARQLTVEEEEDRGSRSKI